MRSPAPRRRLRAALALAALAVAGCTGESAEPAGPSPADAVVAAATVLEKTPGVRLTLRTSDLPAGVSGLTEATGSATSAPAFDGVITVLVGGSAVEVPVISVDGTVHARLPLTSTWSVIDPADYGAPDPAAFLAPGGGFAQMLRAGTGVVRTGQVRGGADNNEVLTEYTATVPGDVVSAVIPAASGQFEAIYSLAENGELRRAAFTGVFYPDSTAMTYTLTLQDYGTAAQITAP